MIFTNTGHVAKPLLCFLVLCLLFAGSTKLVTLTIIVSARWRPMHGIHETCFLNILQNFPLKIILW